MSFHIILLLESNLSPFALQHKVHKKMHWPKFSSLRKWILFFISVFQGYFYVRIQCSCNFYFVCSHIIFQLMKRSWVIFFPSTTCLYRIFHVTFLSCGPSENAKPLQKINNAIIIQYLLGRDQIQNTIRKTWSKDEAKNVIVKFSYKTTGKKSNALH